MSVEAEGSTNELVHRIFLVQIALIIASAILFLAAVYVDIGFFWFSFLAGTFGSSVALLRRVQAGNPVLVQTALASWSATLMPFLYGGIMAGITYFLFVSQVLTGKEGTGLLATNLFPDFDHNAVVIDGERLKVRDWLVLRPSSLDNAGKLVVWCFLAGY